MLYIISYCGLETLYLPLSEIQNKYLWTLLIFMFDKIVQKVEETRTRRRSCFVKFLFSIMKCFLFLHTNVCIKTLT